MPSGRTAAPAAGHTHRRGRWFSSSAPRGGDRILWRAASRVRGKGELGGGRPRPREPSRRAVFLPFREAVAACGRDHLSGQRFARGACFRPIRCCSETTAAGAERRETEKAVPRWRENDGAARSGVVSDVPAPTFEAGESAPKGKLGGGATRALAALRRAASSGARSDICSTVAARRRRRRLSKRRGPAWPRVPRRFGWRGRKVVWLRRKDSNLHKRIQSPRSCR